MEMNVKQLYVSLFQQLWNAETQIGLSLLKYTWLCVKHSYGMNNTLLSLHILWSVYHNTEYNTDNLKVTTR